MNLQESVTTYINCLESPPNGNGRHYIKFSGDRVLFSEQYLSALYDAYGRDETNTELDRQFKERRRQS